MYELEETDQHHVLTQITKLNILERIGAVRS